MSQYTPQLHEIPMVRAPRPCDGTGCSALPQSHFIRNHPPCGAQNLILRCLWHWPTPSEPQGSLVALQGRPQTSTTKQPGALPSNLHRRSSLHCTPRSLLHRLLESYERSPITNDTSASFFAHGRHGRINDLRHLVAFFLHVLQDSIRLIAHRYAVLVPHNTPKQLPIIMLLLIGSEKRGR